MHFQDSSDNLFSQDDIGNGIACLINKNCYM